LGIVNAAPKHPIGEWDTMPLSERLQHPDILTPEEDGARDVIYQDWYEMIAECERLHSDPTPPIYYQLELWKFYISYINHFLYYTNEVPDEAKRQAFVLLL
jgi:hypothetical protein